jgi:hypothetical protein
MSYNQQILNSISAACMDILVDKPGFPDFTFILYRDGWFTHHIVVERKKVKIGGTIARGAKRRNYSASNTIQVFDVNYANKVFDAIENLNREEELGLNADIIGIVPFDNREAEILSLGKLETYNGTERTLIYTGHEGKRIKIYSPQQEILDRYIKGAKSNSN